MGSGDGRGVEHEWGRGNGGWSMNGEGVYDSGLCVRVTSFER